MTLDPDTNLAIEIASIDLELATGIDRSEFRRVIEQCVCGPMDWRPVEKPWGEYTLGTVARDYAGCTWTRTVDGWEIDGGGIFRYPSPRAHEVLLPSGGPADHTEALRSAVCEWAAADAGYDALSERGTSFGPRLKAAEARLRALSTATVQP
jgi:hypothetical protein